MDTTVFNRSDHVLELIAESIGEDPGEIADKLLAQSELRRYVLLETLAETRGSTVIAAVDRILARAVALKIHHAQEFFVRRQLMFGNRAMARVEHPNVVRVHDLGEHEGWLYSTLELCDTNLHAWAPERPWADVLERLIEAGRGLQAIHGSGLVHGDVKPANILIKGGVAKLGDLDLAAIDGGLALWVRGSAGYVAPEVGRGSTEIASDVFGFACTVWASLYGCPPFGASSGGDGELERLMELARVGAVRPVEIGPMTPDLTRSLLPALEPRPEDRMSLAELLEAIAALLSRLVFVLMFAAECAGREMPFIDVVRPPERPGISSGAETVEFFHEGGAWFSRVLITERRARERRVRALPARAKPAEIDLLDWASDIAREFIARGIGE